MRVVNPLDRHDWITVSEAPLSAEQLASWATRPDCGAVVTFCGVARNSSTNGHLIQALEYDTSSELAEQRMQQVVTAARAKWPQLGAVVIHHRVGLVSIGEPAVVIVVSSAHRDAAYEASRYCIDTVKRFVPMWKREIWEGGSAWSEEAHELLRVEDL